MDCKEYFIQEEPHVTEAIEDAILQLSSSTREVAQYVLSSGGKRLRPLLVLLFARHFQCKKDGLYPLAISLELIHSATLLHDDIIDSSTVRRGKPCAHKVFGTTKTILAGDAMLALGCLLVSEREMPCLLGSISTMIMRTVEGEIAEIDFAGKVMSPREYIDVLRGKTGFMVRTACELGALFAEASKEDVAIASEFGESIGIAFQIVDDILDYSSTEIIGKPQGIDIAEGKMTLPLFYYLETLSSEKRTVFLEQFLHKGFSQEEQKEILHNVVQSNALDRAFVSVQQYIQSALQALEKYDDTVEKAILHDLALYVLQRTN